MAVHVLALKSGATTAQQHRLGLGVFMPQSSGSSSWFQRRSGLFPGAAGLGDLVGTTGTMQAVVKPFSAWINGTSNVTQGGYSFVNGTDVTLTFDPGEAAVARVDRVIARVKDDAFDASGVQDGFVEVLKGGSDGTAAALPASALLLWEVTVPAGASVGTGGLNWNTVRADKRRFTAVSGGMIPVVDAADRDSSLSFYDGLTVWRRDLRAQQVYHSGAWRWPTTIAVTNAADRNLKVPSTVATTGQQVWRSDSRMLEAWDGARWLEQGALLARKSADQTVTNSTTVVDDSDLVLTLPPGGLYELSGMLIYSAHMDADLKIMWSGPANATLDWSCRALHSASDGVDGLQFVDRQTITSMPGLGGGAANNTVVLTGTLHGLLSSGDGGTLRLRWAQRVANATGSILRASSYVLLRRVG
ncbi:hypothetical protein [Actinomadura macrotermitis]|uniref:Uncharacterized protein n=1 Tax=Actinomadura macrotermitis TaxID=2585200 RepID=A0A7K0C2S8_9ACTN|nr:hypothetical protein [Actinomadura macrotermitis]MQY07749.1 hypothetical protein [Actinomadura macrotermitis]